MNKKRIVSIIVAICMVISSVVVMPMGNNTVKAATFTSETYISNGFSLTIQQSTDANQRISSATLDKIKEVYFKQYPKMRARYNPTRPRAVVMKFDPDYDGVAYTGGDMGGAGIKFSVNYLKSYPNDADCATHELFHVVQGGYMNYNSESFEGAICEGIADYARATYGLYNDLQGWSLGSYSPSQTILTRYASNARFLTWINQNKNSEATYMLNKTMHNGSYTANMWVQLTGMTSDQLWNAYAADPNIDKITLSTQKGETFGIKTGETYKIISAESGLAVSVQNGSTDEGANIQQENYTGDDSQHWTFNYVGNGQYNIINKKSGKGWDVVNGGTSNGTNIAQYNVNDGGNNNQRWVIFERGGAYVLFPVVGGGSMVADLSSSSHNAGANIQLWGWNKSKAQSFIIEPVSGSEINGTLKPFDRIEAEDFITYSTNIGVSIDENDSRSNGGNIGGLLAGAWTRYYGVNFDSDATSIELNYCNPSADSYVNVYIDSMNSTPVAVVQTPHNSSDWNTYSTVKANLTTKIPAGTHDIYLEFKNSSMSGYAQNCDYFKFNRAAQVSDGLTECIRNENTLVSYWGYYVGEWAGATARYSAGSGWDPMTLKVTANNGGAWGVQAFTAPVSVTAGKRYTIYVTLNSDKAGAPVVFKENTTDTIFQEKTLVAGDNAFSGTFTATGDTAQFFFDLGSVAAGTTIKTASIGMAEVEPETTTQAPTTQAPTEAPTEAPTTTQPSDGMTECTLNANTLVGEWGYYVGEWAAATARYLGGKSLSDFTLKVTANNGAAWGVQAFTKNIAVNPGSKYTVKVTLNSDKAGANVLFKEDKSDTTFETKALVSGKNEFTGTYVPTGSEAAFFFDLGAVAAGTTVKVTSFSLTEEKAPETTTPDTVITDWMVVDNSNGVYEYRNATNVQVVNVQQPGFASAQGIYMATTDAIGSVKINDKAVGNEAVAIQGAGALLYLTAIPEAGTKVTFYSTTGAFLGSVEFKYNPEAETTTEPPTEAPTEAPTEEPTTKPNTDGIVTSDLVKVEGYQISTTLGGNRVVGSVEPTINGKTVTGWGLIYGLSKAKGQSYSVSDSDMRVNSNNAYVKSYQSTAAGTSSEKLGSSATATYFVRTMKFAGYTADEFNAEYKVRAYAVLSDGSYVYSNVSSYSVFEVSKNLYNNTLMGTSTAHDFLYNRILTVVDKGFAKVDYNWGNTVVK